MFTKATKQKSKARIGLMGPSGSGKTYTALSIAQGLGKKIAVIDSEHGSASKYSDLFKFDTCELTSFAPSSYIEAIKAAHDYDVLIIDSISHEWAGRNGCLDRVSQISEEAGKGDKNYFAWGKVTPQHNDFIDTLLALPIHLIATMRTKMDYAMVTNDKGKPAPVKVGLGPVQRDGVEYEFDILATLDLDHTLAITKTRYSELDGGVFDKPGKVLGEQIANWLNQGANNEPEVPATKEDFALLTEQADLKGWTTQMLSEYCTAIYGDDFRKRFTKKMVEEVLTKIHEAVKITDGIVEGVEEEEEKELAELF